MSYKTGNRNQLSLFPPTIDDYVSEKDPVRAYDAFVEALNIEELGINLGTPNKGCPAYDPKTMLKLLLYGYSYGWRSSRKLERAVHHNVSFIWLMGGLKPDDKTISRFRKDNREALKRVFVKLAKICVELNLIEGNTLFLDGSKIRGNSSINQTKSKEWLERKLKEITSRIDEILNECDIIDKSETGSLVEMAKELGNKEKLRDKISNALKKLEKTDAKKINLTDNDSVNTKGRQGSHSGYNAQIVVDEKHGLILSNAVVNENNDVNQFSHQIDRANDVMRKQCEVACADAGYSNTKNLKDSHEKGITVVVPTQKQSSHKPKADKPFSKEKFKYDKEQNQYICPKGKILKFSHYSKVKEHYLYRIAGPSNCLNCEYYGECTNNKRGRAVIRLKEEDIKEIIERIYETEKGQETYKKRKTRVELPFGHIKKNLNGGHFLLRGLAGVNAEMAINCICFNISRMLNIFGGVGEFKTNLSKLGY